MGCENIVPFINHRLLPVFLKKNNQKVFYIYWWAEVARFLKQQQMVITTFAFDRLWVEKCPWTCKKRTMVCTTKTRYSSAFHQRYYSRTWLNKRNLKWANCLERSRWSCEKAATKFSRVIKSAISSGDLSRPFTLITWSSINETLSILRKLGNTAGLLEFSNPRERCRPADKRIQSPVLMGIVNRSKHGLQLTKPCVDLSDSYWCDVSKYKLLLLIFFCWLVGVHYRIPQLLSVSETSFYQFLGYFGPFMHVMMNS